MLVVDVGLVVGLHVALYFVGLTEGLSLFGVGCIVGGFGVGGVGLLGNGSHVGDVGGAVGVWVEYVGLKVVPCILRFLTAPCNLWSSGRLTFDGNEMVPLKPFSNDVASGTLGDHTSTPSTVRCSECIFFSTTTWYHCPVFSFCDDVNVPPTMPRPCDPNPVPETYSPM